MPKAVGTLRAVRELARSWDGVLRSIGRGFVMLMTGAGGAATVSGTGAGATGDGERDEDEGSGETDPSR